MKTVKIVFSLIIISALFSACSEPIEYDQKVKPPSRRTNFHLEAEVTATSFKSQDYLKLVVANSSYCNLGEGVIVSISGGIDKQNNISQGEINLVIPDSSCYLIGNFKGKVINNFGRSIVDAIVNVHYGAGIFEADGGELRLTILGVEAPDNLMKYEIEIDGYLEN